MVHNINMHIAIIIGINKKLNESSRTPGMIINKGVPAINIYPAPPPIIRINKGASQIIETMKKSL